MRWRVFHTYITWDRGHLARCAGAPPAARFSAGTALCAVVLALALAGCGKRNAPQPPPDVPITYPRPYPSE